MAAANLDPSVASVLDRRPTADSDDEDELIRELEDADDAHDGGALSAFREQRLQQLHAEFSRAQALRAADHGSYTETRDEKALLDTTTSTRLCVVHFFKPDFHRCGVMDARLAELAPRHYEARFLRINVDNAAWLVARLKVQVLPCVIAFVDGVGVDRIIGFEGLGRRPDTFTTRDLEARLLRCGVLVRAKLEGAGGDGATPGSGRNQNAAKNDGEDDDDDWD